MTMTSLVKLRAAFRAKFRATPHATPRAARRAASPSRAALAALLLLAALPLSAEPIDFSQAIQLALKHSGIILGALADRSRAAQRYQAERYAYIPTVIFGSGLGYSFGQPIAVAGQAPSVFNITHNETVFNLATRESIKAAHSDLLAAGLEYTDQTEQVILDTSLLYIELDNSRQRLASAQQQKQAVDHALYIAQQRQQEGVGSMLDSRRAELDAARVDLRITELEANIDVLRERLGRAIGQSSAASYDALDTVSTSIPAAPPARAEEDIASIALANSASVRVADEHVRAAHLRARAEHRMNYPSLDLAGQYALFAINNYSDYYKKFSRNNYSFGINLRFPVFNLAQNAVAAAADAAAMKAEADAQVARDQVAADAVRARHTLRQLEASARVARLELEVAQANIDAVKLQMEQGHANARDQELARADIANRQVALLESQFQYLRAQLQLLRQTGELHNWALGESSAGSAP
jgi:outer membrane protein TolC